MQHQLKYLDLQSTQKHGLHPRIQDIYTYIIYMYIYIQTVQAFFWAPWRSRQTRLYLQDLAPLASSAKVAASSLMGLQVSNPHPNPNPWADPKSRSISRFCNLHHRSIRVQNWGIYFLDPPRGLGRVVE